MVTHSVELIKHTAKDKKYNYSIIPNIICTKTKILEPSKGDCPKAGKSLSGLHL